MDYEHQGTVTEFGQESGTSDKCRIDPALSTSSEHDGTWSSTPSSIVTVKPEVLRARQSIVSSLKAYMLILIQLIKLPLPRIILTMLVDLTVVDLIICRNIEHSSMFAYIGCSKCMCYHYLVILLLEICLTSITRRISIWEASAVKHKKIESSEVLEIIKSSQIDKETIKTFDDSKHLATSEQKELITSQGEEAFNHDQNLPLFPFQGENRAESDFSCSDVALNSTALPGDTVQTSREKYIPLSPKQNYTLEMNMASDIQPPRSDESERRANFPKTASALAKQKDPPDKITEHDDSDMSPFPTQLPLHIADVCRGGFVSKCTNELETEDEGTASSDTFPEGGNGALVSEEESTHTREEMACIKRPHRKQAIDPREPSKSTSCSPPRLLELPQPTLDAAPKVFYNPPPEESGNSSNHSHDKVMICHSQCTGLRSSAENPSTFCAFLTSITIQRAQEVKLLHWLPCDPLPDQENEDKSSSDSNSVPLLEEEEGGEGSGDEMDSAAVREGVDELEGYCSDDESDNCEATAVVHV